MCLTNNNQGFRNQFVRSIEGQKTEFVFHRFLNKWFIVVAQYGSLPNFYTVQFDVQNDNTQERESITDPNAHMSVPITATCNFGADKEELRGAIQFLVNKTNMRKCPTEIVISLGIKEITGSKLKEIANVLNKIL